jgi:hypothetical protein
MEGEWVNGREQSHENSLRRMRVVAIHYIVNHFKTFVSFFLYLFNYDHIIALGKLNIMPVPAAARSKV